MHIAVPGGEFDWIAIDPDVDRQKMSEQFDTYLPGRRTFEATGGPGQPDAVFRTFVFSRTLRQSDCQHVKIVGENWKEVG